MSIFEPFNPERDDKKIEKYYKEQFKNKVSSFNGGGNLLVNIDAIPNELSISERTHKLIKKILKIQFEKCLYRRSHNAGERFIRDQLFRPKMGDVKECSDEVIRNF